MTTYTCPKGHDSETDDFCDTCGAKIGGSAPTAASTPPDLSTPPNLPTSPGLATAPVLVPASTLTAGGAPCPNCGTPRAGGSRFCEDCGFDHSTGQMPVLDQPTPPTAAASTGGWTVTIEADREYFEANAVEGADFPTDTGRHIRDLPGPQARIGRKSKSKGTDPEIDLSASDPGVSHSHAVLTLGVDGAWQVCDLDSTNGTYLNDEDEQLPAGEARSLCDGDQVHVGAWTTITLHAPS